jgi:hypothetical protein
VGGAVGSVVGVVDGGSVAGGVGNVVLSGGGDGVPVGTVLSINCATGALQAVPVRAKRVEKIRKIRNRFMAHPLQDGIRTLIDYSYYRLKLSN